MKHSFLVQVDTDDMEYHAAFDAQATAEALLATVVATLKEQKCNVLDSEVNYLGAN